MVLASGRLLQSWRLLGTGRLFPPGRLLACGRLFRRDHLILLAMIATGFSPRGPFQTVGRA
jgi:hypothetical protein